MKEHFLFNPQIAYLNHGSFGAAPKEVFSLYQKYQMDMEIDPVEFFINTGPKIMKESKAALADYINCPTEDLIFLTNPSTAINLIIKNINLKEGDEILSTNMEYGPVDMAWEYYCKKNGTKYIRQEISLPLNTVDQFMDEFWGGLSPRTKVICISQITSGTALIYPVKEICKRAKELGILMIIDGAHVPGHIPLDILDLQPDFYTGACHKWLLAPKGCSFLYAAKHVKRSLDPLIISWGYDPEHASETSFQDFHEYQGTRDFTAFLTVPACLKFMKDNNWKEKTKASRSQLKHYYPIIAKELNSTPICAISDTFLGQICSIPIKTTKPQKLKNLLYQKYKIEIPIFDNVGPVIYTRVSFQPYNTEKEIELYIDAVRDIRKTTFLIE